jgi:hypothetical protein
MTQQEALNILKAGRNVYLTGAAGSGKTYVLNQYIQYLREHGVSVAVTASTGIAATHLGGMTIHSWSGMGIKDDLSEYDVEMLLQKEPLYKRYAKTKVLIIDEISMLHPRFFDALDRLARAMKGSSEPFGGMQVVLSGDFFQLPPIVKGGDEVAYVDSSDAWRIMDIRVCYLSEQYRADDMTLERVLEEIRSGGVSTATLEMFEEMNGMKVKRDITPTRLYTHNKDVDAVNEEELEKIDNQLFEYDMKTSGRANVVAGMVKSILAPETLQLKEDAVVMFVKNNFEVGYVNGTLGRVIGFEDEYPIVELFDGREVNVSPATWEVVDDGKVIAQVTQLPLRLAWAITVHKSQGMSLDAAEIDLSRSFVSGQGYVALSRLRSLEGLTLLGLNRMALSVDPYVLELNRWLLRESAKWVKATSRFSQEEWDEMHEEFVLKSGGTTDIKEIEENRAKEAEPIKKKIPSHEETLALLKEGKSIKEIASERKLTVATIISHLEKLVEGEYDVDLKMLKPKAKDLKAIKSAFTSDMKLAPAHKKLKGKYTFEELKIARLFVHELDKS